MYSYLHSQSFVQSGKGLGFFSKDREHFDVNCFKLLQELFKLVVTLPLSRHHIIFKSPQLGNIKVFLRRSLYLLFDEICTDYIPDLFGIILCCNLCKVFLVCSVNQRVFVAPPSETRM